ncbi:MAG TPA: hypothetical protein VJH71_00365 [Candidatus Paceibacterota bacterium]
MLMWEGYKKLISILILVSVVFIPLHYSKAASGWLIVLKEYGLDLAARLISRLILNVTSNLLSLQISSSGRDGGPAFVVDWREFLQQAQYRGENVARALIGDAILGPDAQVCPYMRGALANIFNINSIPPGFKTLNYRLDSLQYFNVSNKCTITDGAVVGSIRQDFTKGGWTAWEKLIQPQNNFYGVFANSYGEIVKQRAFEQGIDTSEAESGSGYTSKRAGCVGVGDNRQCTLLGKVVTPADIFGKTGAATIDRELDWVVGSDEIQEVIISVADSLVNKLENFAFGLLPGGTTINDLPNVNQELPAIDGAQRDCSRLCVIEECPTFQPVCVDTNGNGVLDDRETDSNCADSSEQTVRQRCVDNCNAKSCN